MEHKPTSTTIYSGNKCYKYMLKRSKIRRCDMCSFIGMDYYTKIHIINLIFVNTIKIWRPWE
ncbi:hypothetical protein AHEV_058 [Adoxophyes honmai entomopoxvirus 'L']|uniref:Uncharacterized protein n=1 Tax=Adoxophyes honmai entomopoxvirus 'L' TaxID=1293540 RepID=A0A916P0S6_9POXV|nr:hypothetical protein AHEV_058 [Adoxophyes honmai entomopoxvirus 'L']CCU55379.1 hypothetical protein AHEV_058 [Adoxophyes honmai entomopoxvirus 'L']